MFGGMRKLGRITVGDELLDEHFSDSPIGLDHEDRGASSRNVVTNVGIPLRNPE